ncbi:MAG TPA: TetR/AcrR family transcriptional regulator C-terminal domain-containing protein [Acidimicrobiia bacterium]|nr:TetR/AcrR family transcriptional regulator C-terminal domain-containing protein [Acidimicrobiia bacterium]
MLRAAIAVADQGGIATLTMRKLAQELGVEAMSLYYHVTNKDQVLDGVVDVIISEINAVVSPIEVPAGGNDWKTAMRARILAARKILLQHPWAPEVIESRATMSFSIMSYFEGALAVFRSGGFSYDQAHHAMHALGSRALGFSQELFKPDNDDTGADDKAAELIEEMASLLPNLVGMMSEIAHDDPDSTLGWCDDQTEFEFGLDLILDGLDKLPR